MAGGAVVAASAAARARRIQNIIDAFRLADATALGRARSLTAIGAERNGEFDNLVRDGVLIAGASADTWYLSEAGYIALAAKQRRTGLRAVAFIIALATVLLIVAAAMTIRRS